ncbi:sodium/substrate symporter small subunit [Melaminivora sp.]|uniref:DUF4212 domain-containing protein n=1 Tax=Melaminivora sp. TaxID=1933032 RepID=UPI0028AC92CC|nr:sodium/substrate symporter small subunit [Melaminivora sp.]
MPGLDSHPQDDLEQAPFAPDLHDARHLWLKGALLSVWALASFVACYFARDLQLLTGSWTFVYWLASQGAVLIFIALVCIYCVAMGRFERADGPAAAAPDGATPHG